ncbi:MAG TPA: putative porin [Chthoniobacteraceae bacterium]|nr:putative porin [Chthoniobacteraceae bacterium]
MNFRDRILPLLVVAVGAASGLTAQAGRPVESGEVAANAVTPPGNLDTALLGAEPPDLAPVAAAPPARRKSTSVTINLIHRMVERGLLPKEDADALIKDAEADAEAAREDATAARAAAQDAAASAQAARAWLNQAGAIPEPLPPAEDSMRITYIPETVKAQMREEIKQEVMDQARNERWAAPRQVPEWTTRIKLFGDIRLRYEGLNFPSGNDNTGAFPNFNAINTGAPFDVAGTVFSPQLNVDRTRNRFRVRARLGAEADLANGFSAGLRIGTGENNNPVTANQSLGLANQGQGGNFSKYAIWLDRAFLKYEVGGLPEKNFAATVGRFDNPFFATTMMWANDLGFDGALLQGRYKIAKGLTPFFAGGAFPVFNTDINYASNNPSKFKSTDKYLYGGQAGFDWKLHKDFNFKAAAGYYHFEGVQGKLSDPFVPLTAQDQGNTDNTRPSFAQNGNTYRPLRNILPTAANNFGTTNQYQFFGLASDFREFAVTGRLDYNRYEPCQVSLNGEYIKNLAFNQSAIEQVAVNNRGPETLGKVGRFAGGDTAWLVGLTVGRQKLDHLGAWNVGVNYRYVESDSLIDGFADSDFGAPLTGTNLKGYTLFGNLALSPRISVGLRWMSADAIAGPPYKSDVVQFDVNGSF